MRSSDGSSDVCSSDLAGKGHRVAEPGERLVFEPVGPSESIDKSNFAKRLLVELQVGFELLRQVRRTKVDVAMLSNAQLPTLVVLAIGMLLLRKPWVLWPQDVYAVAITSFACAKHGHAFRQEKRRFGK